MARIPLCSICEEPAMTARIEKDGSRTAFCPNHLPEEAREVYDELIGKGWVAPPAKTIQ